jgi:hypothetical protein
VASTQAMTERKDPLVMTSARCRSVGTHSILNVFAATSFLRELYLMSMCLLFFVMWGPDRGVGLEIVELGEDGRGGRGGEQLRGGGAAHLLVCCQRWRGLLGDRHGNALQVRRDSSAEAVWREAHTCAASHRDTLSARDRRGRASRQQGRGARVIQWLGSTICRRIEVVQM